MTLHTTKPKQKTCVVCKCKFEPFKPMQKVCDWGCAVSLGVSDRAKAEKVAV